MTDRRAFIKLAVAATGAFVTPVITTFNVPLAAALTSGCACSNDKSIYFKEFFWSNDGRGRPQWVETSTTDGNCRPSCWIFGRGSASDDRVRLASDPFVNNPLTIVSGPSCSGDNAGIFQVSAVLNGNGRDCDADISFTSSMAVVSSRKKLDRVFVVACC